MATQTMSEVRAAIRERSDVFENHFARGDAAALVRDYYVEQPIMSAPDAELLHGRESITALFSGVMQGFVACKLEQIDVKLGGDLAYEVSRATLTPRETGADVKCRYMIAWRHTSVGWRVETDFFAWGII